jgi:hypothetical protein
MAVAEVLLCDRCGKVIQEELELADHQGGPIEVRFPAYTQKLALCSACLKVVTLFEIRELGERVLAGTLTVKDALLHLPRA